MKETQLRWREKRERGREINSRFSKVAGIRPEIENVRLVNLRSHEELSDPVFLADQRIHVHAGSVEVSSSRSPQSGFLFLHCRDRSWLPSASAGCPWIFHDESLRATNRGKKFLSIFVTIQVKRDRQKFIRRKIIQFVLKNYLRVDEILY